MYVEPQYSDYLGLEGIRYSEIFGILKLVTSLSFHCIVP